MQARLSYLQRQLAPVVVFVRTRDRGLAKMRCTDHERKEESCGNKENSIRRRTLVTQDEVCLPTHDPNCAQANEDHDYSEDCGRDELYRGWHGKSLNLRHNVLGSEDGCVQGFYLRNKRSLRTFGDTALSKQDMLQRIEFCSGRPFLSLSAFPPVVII